MLSIYILDHRALLSIISLALSISIFATALFRVEVHLAIWQL